MVNRLTPARRVTTANPAVPVRAGSRERTAGSLRFCSAEFLTNDWTSEQVKRMHDNRCTFREVPGIGDRSFLYDMRATGAALCVFRSDYYLQISVFRRGEASK